MLASSALKGAGSSLALQAFEAEGGFGIPALLKGPQASDM